MLKKILSLVLAFALVLSLAACGASNPPETTPPAEATSAGTEAAAETTSPAAAETVLFTDACGREVEVPAQISRLVPSGPLSQIVLYAIAPEMFVGLAAKWDASAQGIIPEDRLNLPYFGQLYGSANLNVEELALADPQIFIDVGQPKGSIAEDMDALQTQTEIPAVFVSATLETMPQTFRTLGKLLNREEKGEALAAFCERIYSRTTDILTQVGDNKVDALYVLGEAGLNVLANGSYQAELIDMLVNNLAVVENPASKGTGNEVSMEQIALWDPPFVIFAPDSIYDTVSENATWSEISAIRSGRYVKTPCGPHNWMGSPPSVQRYLGMIWLTAVLYPEYCDYDVKADVLEYYQLFYDCALTDEQYDALVAGAFPKA